MSDPGRRNSEPQEPPKKLEGITSLELLDTVGELDPETYAALLNPLVAADTGGHLDPTRPPEIQATQIVTLGYSTAPQEENQLF